MFTRDSHHARCAAGGIPGSQGRCQCYCDYFRIDAGGFGIPVTQTPVCTGAELPSRCDCHPLRAKWQFPRRRWDAKLQCPARARGVQPDVRCGCFVGLLGIGSGAMKVFAMDQTMKVPFKVSTTTSNFMIGVTAAASAGVYLNRGYVDPGLAMPVMLGVLTGSLLGARILVKAETKWLRLVFSAVIVLLGAEMLYKGLSGGM